MALIKVELQDTFEEWRIKINQISAQAGDLTGINPNYTGTTLVGILNEIREQSKFENYLTLEDRAGDNNTKIITNATNLQFFINNAITGHEPTTGTPKFELKAAGATLSSGSFAISNGDINFSATGGVGNINNAAHIYSENIDNSNHIETKTINVSGNATITGNVTAATYYAGCSSFSTNTSVCGNLGVDGTTTLNNLTVTGSVNLGTSTTNVTKLSISDCVSSHIYPCTDNVYDIGSSSKRWNQVFAVSFEGTATSAKYADLAEKYLADADYEVGTVIAAGGEAEVTAATSEAAHSVIGVISENPAIMMNSDLEGGTYIALKGRVPVRVQGDVKKGDRLVASELPGVAEANNAMGMWSFAVALTDKVGDTVEAVIL